jgi:uncharacterized protein
VTRGTVADSVGPLDARDPLRTALRRVLDEAYAVNGALFATADGILLAAEFCEVALGPSRAHPESVAALAAATSGVAGRFTHLIPMGEATATIIQGSRGCVAVQPLGQAGVLVLYGTDGSTAGRLHLAARQATPILEEALRGDAP